MIGGIWPRNPRPLTVIFSPSPATIARIAAERFAAYQSDFASGG
jgi:hypothetical protein